MKKKNYKMAQPFFDKMLRDPEIKMLFDEERARTHIAHAVRAARLRAGLTQLELAKKSAPPKALLPGWKVVSIKERPP